MDRRTLLKAMLAAALAPPELSVLAADPETLRALGARRNLLVGSAIEADHLSDQSYQALFAEQCSIIVPENEMKWDSIHPEQDRYDFRDADAIAAFAAKNSIRLRGHNLCWHDSQPLWFTRVANSKNAAQLLQEHIATVAGRYAGRIHSWDVVNEAIDPNDRRPDSLRNSNWLQLLGKDYIAIAFRAAAKADPKALLTYNDYGLENDPRRQQAALGLLRWMRQNHVPIHALGLESHFDATYNEGPDWSSLHDFLKEVARLDLQVFVTELEINDLAFPGKPGDGEKESAWLCRDYLKNVLKHPNVTAILTWGLITNGPSGTSGYTARHHELPFEPDLRPGPFYAAMQDALRKA